MLERSRWIDGSIREFIIIRKWSCPLIIKSARPHVCHKFSIWLEVEALISDQSCTSAFTEDRKMEESGKKKIVVGVDDSEQSVYALQWTLDYLLAPFPVDPPFKLFLVHARPSATSALGLAGPGTADILPALELDLKRIGARDLEQAKGLCQSRSIYDFEAEMVEGDARNVLCEAVERHGADILVVGSHGYGAIKRAVLGSVSDYCAHHAKCSVMIVKKPKH